MATEILFGLALSPLFSAIAEVESTGGKYSPNVYQISDGYIADVNRISERLCLRKGVAFRPFPPCAKFDRRTSERMMVIYWSHWGADYEAHTGGRVTYEALARIHNGGPLGWKKRETERYWRRVKDALDDASEGGGK